jgi:hypothetical protein
MGSRDINVFGIISFREIAIRILTDPPLFIADPQFGSILRPNNKTRYIRRECGSTNHHKQYGFP